MAYPTAAGFPNQSGVLIPEIWAGKALVKFYASTVFGEVANTDYEGEITSMGDKVHIRTVPDITIRDYVKGQSLVYDTPEAETVELLIDQGKYYSFKINDVDKAQSDMDYMEQWSDDAGEQLKIAIDTDILANVYADADSDNKGSSAGTKSGNIDLGSSGSPVEVTKANAVDKIVEIGQVLDEQNVPETDRWMVIPPWLRTRALLGELKDASLTGDGKSALRNGRLGVIDRFTLYNSNNLTKVNDASYGGDVWEIVAGHKSALTFASQLVNNEDLPNPNDFGRLIRGLQVFGYSVIKPTAMVEFYAAPGSL